MASHLKEYWSQPDQQTLLAGWAREGLTNEQIAKNMGIGERTFYKWLSDDEHFMHVLKRGKEIADYEVENALFESAMSGNVTAQIFWLKNRRRDRWRDKPPESIEDKTVRVVFDVDEEDE